MMIEIFRQLKNQAMLFALRVKYGRTIFCVQTTQCAVPCKGKQTGWETTLTQSRIVSITIFLNYFHHFAK